MGTKICMNVSCGTSNTHEWRNGWPLRSGGFAHLCFKCGAAYEKSVFCDTFHLGETGWRECSSCRKSLHCGCVASTSLYECLDYGGVGCISCSNSSQPRVVPRNDVLNGFCGPNLSNDGDRNSNSVEYRADTVDEGKFLQLCGTVDEGKLLQLCKIMEANESTILPQSPTGEESAFLESNLLHRPQRNDKSESLGQTKGQEVIHQTGQVSPGFFSPTQSSNGSLTFAAQPDNGRTMSEVNHTSAPSSHPSLSMSLGAPSTAPSFMQPFSGAHMDIRDQSKTPLSSQQVPKPRPIFPRPLQSPLPPASSETNRSVRVARPPAEGWGKNQLLPRYWPRITDQELQKLAGALNATIVPLFEKVLSASDAGRIGRLVLPKACAEAYFPHISHSEGLPIRIQDVKGNEWTFQFRFWPNNNSRMYVLEGVSPCIQSMQLQAGDTVTFSRLDPGNKLVIGFRKASQSVNMQGPVFQNGTPGETSFSTDHLATGSGDSSLFRMNNGSKDPSLTSPSDHHLAEWDKHMQNHENNGHRTSEDLLHPVSNSEKKRARNIGPKSKRFLMHSEDVMELRLTWEDAQDLLRPPPSVKPSIVTIGDFEFEEFDEPPVYGKRSIFTAGPSIKGQEQWAQCDDCSKWRKLPGEVLLPPRWRCSENSWDSSRSSCTAPEEISSKQLDNFLNSYVFHKGLRKRRKIIEKKEAEEQERSGLDALASVAILGDNVHESGEQSIGATTRHPRHRPGCTCIVCIQPPSGKGKHKPSCRCNVCLTVKRRFTTMMQRKLEKRQLEREAEDYQRNNGNYKDDSETNGITMGDAALHRNNNADISQMNNNNHKDESEMNGTMSGDVATLRDHSSENGASSSQSRSQADATEITNAGQIDLNFDLSSFFRNPTPQDLLNLAKASPDGQASEKYTNENPLKAMIDEDQAGLDESFGLSSFFRNPAPQDLLNLAKAAPDGQASEKYTNDNLLKAMIDEDQAGLASCTLAQANGDNETQLPNEAHHSSCHGTPRI